MSVFLSVLHAENATATIHIPTYYDLMAVLHAYVSHNQRAFCQRFFRNEYHKINNTGARLLGSIYHMAF